MTAELNCSWLVPTKRSVNSRTIKKNSSLEEKKKSTAKTFHFLELESPQQVKVCASKKKIAFPKRHSLISPRQMQK